MNGEGPRLGKLGLSARAMSANISLRFKICRVGEATPLDYDAKTALDSPENVERFWRTIIAARPDDDSDKEHLVAIGNLNECIAHPRDILRPVVVVPTTPQGRREFCAQIPTCLLQLLLLSMNRARFF